MRYHHRQLRQQASWLNIVIQGINTLSTSFTKGLVSYLAISSQLPIATAKHDAQKNVLSQNTPLKGRADNNVMSYCDAVSVFSIKSVCEIDTVGKNTEQSPLANKIIGGTYQQRKQILTFIETIDDLNEFTRDYIQLALSMDDFKIIVTNAQESIDTVKEMRSQFDNAYELLSADSNYLPSINAITISSSSKFFYDSSDGGRSLLIHELYHAACNAIHRIFNDANDGFGSLSPALSEDAESNYLKILKESDRIITKVIPELKLKKYKNQLSKQERAQLYEYEQAASRLLKNSRRIVDSYELVRIKRTADDMSNLKENGIHLAVGERYNIDVHSREPYGDFLVENLEYNADHVIVHAKLLDPCFILVWSVYFHIAEVLKYYPPQLILAERMARLHQYGLIQTSFYERLHAYEKKLLQLAKKEFAASPFPIDNPQELVSKLIQKKTPDDKILNSRDAIRYHRAALQLVSQGDTETAIALWNELVNNKYTRFAAHINLARAYIQRHDHDRAFSHIIELRLLGWFQPRVVDYTLFCEAWYAGGYTDQAQNCLDNTFNLLRIELSIYPSQEKTALLNKCQDLQDLLDSPNSRRALSR